MFDPRQFPFAFSSRTISQVLLAAAATLWCAALVFGRVTYTGTTTYTFLLWNLFLAIVPLGFALLLERSGKFGERPIFQLGLLSAWLLFFPNAPYVLTDLIHLEGKRSPLVPLWYDLGMLLSAAFTGLLFGFAALEKVQRFVARSTNAPWSWSFVVVVMFLSGFGIYLGRFLRWNSWDLLARPGPLLADIADRFLHPFDHPRTFLVTVLFGGFLTLAYLGFRAGSPRRTPVREMGEGA